MNREILLTVATMTLILHSSDQRLDAQSRSQIEAARNHMVDTAVIGAGVTDRRVIQSMRETPRHEFVRSNLRARAYQDAALPIGDKQTISSPFIVAYMTESLQPQATDKVLEIGTGSGYQAAVLSPLVQEVYTIEIVESLGRRAARTLSRLGYKNVFATVGDGFKGWPEHAPFDKIIVTCSPERIPVPLVQQLKEGGLMVIPVGERYQQTLYLMRKKDGELQSEALRPTLFVPMTGAAESSRQVKPDPANPKVINGGFEEKVGENGFVPGWYYQRQHVVEEGPQAPEGRQFVTFRNKDEGLDAHLMQGFSVDGRQVKAIRLSAFVKHATVFPGLSPKDLPLVAVTFYDTDRRELATGFLGPFRGTADWHRLNKNVTVPPQAREGILRIGLFGGVGEISFDDVQMSAIR